MTEIGTNSSGAAIRDVKSTIGPSAPPMDATATASFGARPNHTPSTSVANVPASAKMAMMMEVQGLARMKPISHIAPTPMKTMQATRLFEKVKL